jgi:hypothetical protein
MISPNARVSQYHSGLTKSGGLRRGAALKSG